LVVLFSLKLTDKVQNCSSMQKISNEDLGRHSLESFQSAEKKPYVVVLDNIRSAQNVGSVFRTADSFAAEKLYLCGITAAPPQREISKTALGAELSMAWEYHPQTLMLIEHLKSVGYIIAVIEQVAGSTSLENFTPESGKKYALVFGNEVMGVDEAVVKEADLAIEIPQFGTKHSLNIAVTAGIVCWKFAVG
jgi:tRNA G18 (ribose-2'-O)-methylase SpoU